MTTITTRSGQKVSVEDSFAELRSKIRDGSTHVEVRLVGGGSALLHLNDLAVVAAEK